MVKLMVNVGHGEPWLAMVQMLVNNMLVAHWCEQGRLLKWLETLERQSEVLNVQHSNCQQKQQNGSHTAG